MKKSLLALASVLAIVAGCAKENISGSIRTHSGIKQITATIEAQDATKAYLAEYKGKMKFHWLEEEAINVGAGEVFPGFVLVEGYDTPIGKFESDEDLPEADFWFACSPEDIVKNSVEDSLYVTIPSELTYDSEYGAATGGEIMVAKGIATEEGDKANFTFRNAVGYIKFQLQLKSGEAAEQIESIDVCAKDGCDLAGDAKIVFDGNKIDTVRFISSGNTTSSITVKFNEDVTVSDSEPFQIYIPIAPMKNGVTIAVSMKSGKAMTASSSTGVNIGQILELPVLRFDPLPVAKIGEEEYYSIDKAIEAANDLNEDVTVTLIRDCTAGKNCKVLSQYGVVTVDLNGYTLYSSGSRLFTVAKGNKDCVIVDNSEAKSGKMTNINPSDPAIKVMGFTTIKSGTICSANGRAIEVGGGTLIVEGGSVEGSYGIYCRKDADASVDSIVVKGDATINSTVYNALNFNAIGGEIIIRGGTIQSGKDKAGITLYDGSLKIYDGFIGANSYVVYAYRSSNNQVDIYGGFFHRDATTNSIVYGHLTTDSTRVWGGYYNNAPGQAYIPDGYSITSCDTTVRGISFKSTIAKAASVVATVSIGGGTPVEKATINEAFKTAMQADQDAVIKLIADCSSKDSMEVKNNKKLTVDFNGHTLSFSDRCIFKILGPDSDVTFKSSVDGGGIHQTSSGSGRFCFRQDTGKVTVESGKYQSNLGQYGFYATGGELNIKGGEFYADSTFLWCSKDNKVNISGGKFIKCESNYSDKKLLYVTTGGEANITGGSFSSFYLYSGNCSATISGIVCDSLKLGGGSSSNIIFNGGTINGKTEINGPATINGGTFNGKVEVASTVTIKDGTFTNETSNALYVIPGGDVTIDGGKFNGNTVYGTIRSCGSTVINDGVIVTAEGEGSNALYVGSDKNAGSMIVNGGKFTGYKTVAGCNGTLSISGGFFKSMQRAVLSKSACATEISGGYFNTPADSAIFTGSGAKGIAKGGWFTQPLADSLINPAFILDNTKSTEVEGVTYNYQVIENAGAPDVVSVNGTAFKSVDAAINAAETAIATGNVTFKVLGDCSTLTSLDISGTNTFTIDLNGHNLKTQVNSTVSTLNVTDNSADANGSFIAITNAHGFNITGGTMNFDKGKIEDIDTCAVCVKGETAVFNMTGGVIVSENPGSATGSDGVGAVAVLSGATFNFSDGMIDSPKANRGVWNKSGNFNMTGGTIIANTYPLYVYSAAISNISGGVMIQMNESSGNICHNGTSNESLKVNISGGYFYAKSGKSFTCYKPTSDGKVNKFNVTGGYFSMDVKAKASSNFAYPSGYELKKVDPKATQVVKGVTYEFGYQVTTK